MKSFRFNRSTVLIIITLLVILSIGIRIYLYHLGGKLIPVTSDEAITVLQAEDIRNGQFPLLMASQPYLFPMEAYWMAPLVNVLPRTALGMRTLVLLEGFAFTLLCVLIMRRLGPIRTIWPGYLLILFPSSYILMNQTAYSLPGYNSAYILSLFSAWLIFKVKAEAGRCDIICFFTASLSASLAFTNGMFAISLIAPIGLLALGRAWEINRLPRLSGLLAGGIAGLLPYFAARKLLPGAYDAVTQVHTMSDAIARIWNPALSHTLPVTFGWKPCYFPDNAEVIYWGVWGYRMFPYVFCLLILYAGYLGTTMLLNQWRQKKHRTPGILAWAVMTTGLSLLIFLFSKRADSAAYRYLAPVAVMFPFVIAGILAVASGRIRAWIMAVAMVMITYNFITAFRITKEWKLDYFGPLVMSAPDLKPALAYLKENNIHHAVASYWAAYRIGFESYGEVMGSQPVNERFPGWPLPYKAEVDAATNVAYVLTDTIRHLKPAIFERHLQTMNIEARVYTAGYFRVYHDFRAPDYGRTIQLESAHITVTSSETADEILTITDKLHSTYWRSSDVQNTNLWLEFEFDHPKHLARMIIHYGDHEHDRAPAVAIWMKSGTEWRVWNESVAADIDKFAWGSGHPVYGKAQQTYLLNSEHIKAVRVQIATPNPARHWTIAGIDFFEMTPDRSD